MAKVKIFVEYIVGAELEIEIDGDAIDERGEVSDEVMHWINQNIQSRGIGWVDVLDEAGNPTASWEGSFKYD